jgi:hypothetical protein
LKEVKAKIELAKKEVGDVDEGVASGMKVDEGGAKGDAEGELEGTGEDAKVPKKIPERKTKQQRNKAARILAEVRILLTPYLTRYSPLSTSPSETCASGTCSQKTNVSNYKRR